MTDQAAEKVKQDILSEYRERTPSSLSLFKKAVRFLPGGNTRSLAYFPPYPFYVREGRGCSLYDCDGNAYIDCVNNMTSLIHGHAHPTIVAAIGRQAAKGTAHAAPTDLQFLHAERIYSRMPSMASLRFCNSGTEATMFAIRAARVFTKKSVIVKMDGGYHGSHDYAEVNIKPDLTTKDLPAASVEPGVPRAILKDMRIAPFNDLDAMERILSADKGNVAAVMVEPVLTINGGIKPEKGYLAGLRDLAHAHNALLIFDEVITFRASLGGMQAVEDVRPDLTALGKIIGGGLPVGAFGGRRDIMQMFDPTGPDPVTHSGTFSGNALTMAAGMAALDILGQGEIDRINRLGERLRKNIRDVMKQVGVPGQVGGFGSTVFVVFFEAPYHNAREVVRYAAPTLEFAKSLHLAMLNRGLYAIVRGTLGIFLSTPMDESTVDRIAERFRSALEQTKSLLEKIGLH